MTAWADEFRLMEHRLASLLNNGRRTATADLAFGGSYCSPHLPNTTMDRVIAARFKRVTAFFKDPCSGYALHGSIERSQVTQCFASGETFQIFWGLDGSCGVELNVNEGR